MILETTLYSPLLACTALEGCARIVARMAQCRFEDAVTVKNTSGRAIFPLARCGTARLHQRRSRSRLGRRQCRFAREFDALFHRQA